MNQGKYNIIEFASPQMKGFRGKFIRLDELSSLATDYREAYTSMFLYSDEVLDYISRNLRNGKPSIAGYNGPVFSNYICWDIDSENLEKAQDAAKQLVEFFNEKWRVGKNGVVPSFSSRKGFHIYVDANVFDGFIPSPDLNRYHAEIRRQVPKIAELKLDHVDLTISDKSRLLRLINTVNPKSGLYKIQLDLDELYLPVDEIRELAKKPRKPLYTDETGLSPRYKVEPVGEAVDFYKKIRIRPGVVMQPVQKIDDSRSLSGIFCEARMKLFNSRVPEGERNRSALILTSVLRKGGYSEAKTRQIMQNWNRKNSIGLSDYELEHCVIQAVFRSPSGYDFGCNSLDERYCAYTKDRWECRDYRLYKLFHFDD